MPPAHLQSNCRLGAVVTVPDFVPHECRRAQIAVMLLAFLGLISAVHAMTVECHDKHLAADDGITLLTAEVGVTLLTMGRQQCQLVVGGRRPSSVASVGAADHRKIPLLACLLDINDGDEGSAKLPRPASSVGGCPQALLRLATIMSGKPITLDRRTLY